MDERKSLAKYGLPVFLILALLTFSSDVTLGDDLLIAQSNLIAVRQWLTAKPLETANAKDRVYVLEFWATWCPPCIKTTPHMLALHDKYKDEGLVIIALSQDKSPEKVREFIRKNKITYHVAIDNATAMEFSVKALPNVVVLSHEGKVVWQGLPWQPEFEAAIKKALKTAKKARSS